MDILPNFYNPRQFLNKKIILTSHENNSELLDNYNVFYNYIYIDNNKKNEKFQGVIKDNVFIMYRNDFPNMYKIDLDRVNRTYAEIEKFTDEKYNLFLKAWQNRRIGRNQNFYELYFVFKENFKLYDSRLKSLAVALLNMPYILEINLSQYFTFVYIHLFDIFVGGENMKVFPNDRDSLNEPNNICYTGCLLLWLLHISSEILSNYYYKHVCSDRHKNKTIMEICPIEFVKDFTISFMNSIHTMEILYNRKDILNIILEQSITEYYNKMIIDHSSKDLKTFSYIVMYRILVLHEYINRTISE